MTTDPTRPKRPARLHLVDGTYELYRAHFSKRPGHKAPDGRDVKATVALASSLLALLHDAKEGVTHLAVAFDNPIRSFRNDLFSGYKSDEGVPEELHAQFDSAEEATRALGIVVWSMNRFEADDALASAATRFANEVGQVRILTPDKDLGQVVNGTRVVQVDRMRKKLIDEEALVALRGVPPGSIADWLALMGDTSDGYPGLPGWGSKSAAVVLARWGSIENIPTDPNTWDVKVTGAPRLSAVLEANRREAALYKKLALLRLDVPLRETLGDLAHRGVPKGPWEKFCDRLGLRDLRERALVVRPSAPPLA